MKILLLGEFSGLHTNLKNGLLSLGHEVTLVSNGDGWKKIGGDFNVGSNRRGLLGKVERFLRIFFLLFKIKNYDVVQFVSPIIVPRIILLNKIFIWLIAKKNKKLFLSGAGATNYNSISADFFENHFKYHQYHEVLERKEGGLWSQGFAGRKYNDWLMKKINGYIPIMYEYAQGYRLLEHPKLCPTIPIPVSLSAVSYKENIVSGKVVYFHGLNREDEKGTHLITEAMHMLKNKYPSDVDIVIDGKMPLSKYMNLLENVNVVIDQAYTVSYGVNGVYNLALGKVLVGGGEPECLQEFSLKDSPIVPIKPCVDDIFKKLEYILKNKTNIPDWGVKSRKYAENVHGAEKIARKYIEVWESR